MWCSNHPIRNVFSAPYTRTLFKITYISVRSEDPKFEFRCTRPRRNGDHNNVRRHTSKVAQMKEMHFVGFYLFWHGCNQPEGKGLLVTSWRAESSAYQSWQTIMVFHRAVDQFKISLYGKSLWDTIIDCQDLYGELKINHLVTRRTWPTVEC